MSHILYDNPGLEEEKHRKSVVHIWMENLKLLLALAEGYVAWKITWPFWVQFFSLLKESLNLLVGELQNPCYYTILFVASDIMIPKVNALFIDFFQYSIKNYFTIRILQNMLFKSVFFNYLYLTALFCSWAGFQNTYSKGF